MTRWITVEDKLPELMVKAIWYNELGEMIVGIYTKLGWTFSYCSGVATHRKPLPDPPKGENDG